MGIFIIICCLILTDINLNLIEYLLSKWSEIYNVAPVTSGASARKKFPFRASNAINPTRMRDRRSFSSLTDSGCKIKEIKVLDVKNNIISSYLTIRKAAIAINVDVKSLNSHICSKSLLGLNTLFKDQYLITVELSNSTGQGQLSSNHCGSISLNINTLALNKLYVYLPDKITLAFVFNNIVEACRKLSPMRCEKFTDSELKKNKNVQFILRVINKGVLTKTELGKFYIFKNPGHSDCLALIVWGSNLCSTIGSSFSQKERDMIKLPSYQYSVIIGVVLSDAGLATSVRSKNYLFRFKQSLDKSGYVWFVFSYLAHYCSSLPYLVRGERAGKETKALEFYTRALPCFTELSHLFYRKGIKIIPENIYELLTPVALAHFIMGDGSVREHGLILCTDSFELVDTVRLMNVLMIRYNVDCTLRFHTQTHPRIYIRQRSMPIIRELVKSHMDKSMLYKIGL